MICFGSANALLKPLGDHLSPFFLQLLMGCFFVSVNILTLVGEGRFRDSWILWASNKYLMSWSLSFAFLTTIGFLSLMYAAAQPGASITSLSAIAATNPIVTFFWMALFWNELRTARLQMVVPGLVLCVVGVILLAFSRRNGEVGESLPINNTVAP
jgi:drug/metabolite transporter (DMT)-like permease